MPDPLINQTIGGCAILEIIGQGGMGVIYKGRQKSLDRVVAVKVLAPHLANDANFVTRFQKEARAIARVNHPHILAVYDVGTDQNINYMIMELIEGESLAELQAERRGALEWREATEFVRQSAQGLEAAQATGIIHRDIKPENLMVTRKGQIKVSDFGLAKEADGTGTQTSVDSVMGTPAFMSPEQCDGKKVDGRSDIYSLGGTWYRLITGRLPFEAETAMSTMYRHKHEALIPPNEVLPTVPRAISDVICKMMAKKREHRYQTFTEVIDAIETAVKKAEEAEAGGGAGHYDESMQGPPQQNTYDDAAQRSNAASRFGPASGNTDYGRPAPPQPISSMTGQARRGAPNPQRGSMPGLPGMGGGFMPGGGEQSRINSVLGGGIPGGGQPSLTGLGGMGGMGGMGQAGGMDDGYANVSRGDEMLERGDRVAALKAYMLALQSNSLDNATRSRVEQEINQEFSTRRQNADNLLKRGMLVDAQRECRILSELDPNDATLRNLLKDIESRLALKRTLVNDIRNAIAASQFENAIKIWDGTPAELRDDGLGKQIEQLRVIVVPAAKLAEQGESFSRQGRLEEAIATYEDALKINASCEQARLGLKDSEGKLQRIDYLLKEGYQYNLEQNYAKAIETWKPILNLRPGHPQALKSIVEAYIQHGQTLRAQGDLDGALNLYRGARDTDPANRTIVRMTDEITMLRDKEKQLLDRANEAVQRGRLGEAIHCWKDIAVLNPANRKAQAQIQQIAKKRSGNAAVTFIVVILVAAGSIVAYQYLQEQSLLNKVATLNGEHNYAEALDVLKKHTFLFKSVDSMKVDAADEHEIKQAESRSFSDPKGGAEDYKNLAIRLMPRKPKRAQRLYELALESLSKCYLDQAHELIKQHKWVDAQNLYRRLDSEMKGLKDYRNDDLRKFEEEMNTGKSMVANLIEAERQAQIGNSEAAFDKYKQAEKNAVDLKLDDTKDWIEKQLAESHYDPEIYTTSMKAGIEILSQSQPDLAAAKQTFNMAMQNHPNDVQARKYLDLIDDMKYCDAKGQAMFSEQRPSAKNANFSWGPDERTKAFCIDRYEYPNTSGEMPLVDVPFVIASQKCVTEGKKLCTSTRWKDACQGSTNAIFPYGKGKDADASACNVESKGLVASGSKATCRNSIGVFDMSGNAAEWTEDLTADGVNATVMGGSFSEKAGEANCMSTFTQNKDEKLPNIGFRCCRDMEAKDK